MLLNRTGGGGENVTPQVDTYSSLLEQAIANMAGKVYLPPVLEGEYVWKKLTAEGGEFIDYVVSDDPSAYHDGGEQDGYWYERMDEGLDLAKLFGYTKMAVDKLTYSSDTYPSDGLKHSLGEIPQIAILIGEVDTVANSVFFGIVGSAVGDTTASYSALAFHLVYKQTIAGSVTHPSASAVRFYDYGKTKFLKAGKEFTLITMA